MDFPSRDEARLYIRLQSERGAGAPAGSAARTTPADGEGAVAPGEGIRFRIEKPGFKSAVTSGVTVDAGANVRGDVSLEVGNAAQAVEVAEPAPEPTPSSVENLLTALKASIEQAKAQKSDRRRARGA